MCVVSMVSDHYLEKWDSRWNMNNPNPFYLNNTISRYEFEELKKEVKELKELLIRAKKYDEEHHEHQCETEEKVRLLKEVAKLVGVELSDVLGK